MRIAICTPVHGDTRALFTHSLARMLLTTTKDWVRPGPTPEMDYIQAESSSIAENREYLVRRALDWNADWILWLDSDQVFPPDTLLRLLAHGQPVIGCNYARRNDRAEPTATIVEDGDHKPVFTTREKAASGVVEPVSYLGLGVCLTAIEAIRKLDPPYFHGSNEDEYFFTRLRDRGVDPLVDHALSAQVGHIRLQVLSNAHSVQARTVRETRRPVQVQRSPCPD